MTAEIQTPDLCFWTGHCHARAYAELTDVVMVLHGYERVWDKPLILYYLPRVWYEFAAI